MEDDLSDINENKLNPYQKHGLEIMKTGKNVFLTGAGGVGKSYLLKVFIKWCKQNDKIIGVTSTTGVSALLINGTTIHSFAGILLGMEDKITLLERVRSRDKPYKRWLYTHVLIIDEISMMSGELLEKLDYIGKKIRKSTKPFGGIQLVLSGDYLQLPPIQSQYCFKDPIWYHLIDTNIYLQENMRQTDPVFQKVLNEVRYGNMSSETIQILQSRIGAYIETPPGIIPTKLFSHRATVAKINHDNLIALIKDDNPLVTYQSQDNVKRKDGKMVNSEFREDYLNRIDKIFQADKTLNLCVGAQVMLIFNLDVPGGLANGSRGCIIGFKNGLPIVRFMNGIETVIDKIGWSMKIADDVIVTRKQIPLLIAYAVTIHKCQGSTLDCAQVDLGATLFCYGQGYTALSRVTSLGRVSIVTFDPDKILASPDVVEFYNNLTIPKEKTILEPEAIPDNKLCPICCEREINSIIIPCGHCCSCMECSYNLELCPICRSEITMRNKFHLAV